MTSFTIAQRNPRLKSFKKVPSCILLGDCRVSPTPSSSNTFRISSSGTRLRRGKVCENNKAMTFFVMSPPHVS